MLTHQTRRWKAKKHGAYYITDSNANISVFKPIIAHPHLVCDQNAGKEMAVHSLPRDSLEALSYRYTHPVEAQALISAPLGLPLPGGLLNPNSNNNLVLHDWWSDYDSCQQMEDGQASGLSPGLWPWTMSWYGDVNYQDDSTSAASIASPFIQGDDQCWGPGQNYDKETAATPWLPRDYSFSPSSDSSFRSPRAAARAASSKTAIQMKSICPKPILPRPEDDENTNNITRRRPRRGEPQTCRRSTSADCKDVFLVQSKLAGMSYKQIKEKGQFVEAESTLRGRFRTLTKHKEHRVRKPEWQEGDVSIPVTPDPGCAAIDGDVDPTSWQSCTGSLERFENWEALASRRQSCRTSGRIVQDSVEAGRRVYLGEWRQLPFW